jgi:hypothetical protein
VITLDEISEILMMIVFGVVMFCLVVMFVFGSPALILSVFAGGVWFFARSNESAWVRALSPNAGALSVGFGFFALLYIVLAHRDYSDPQQLASAGDLAWFIETTLLDVRTFLQQNFGSTLWFFASVSATVVLALLSERLGSYGLVTKFVGLQGWLSRFTFALVAATTFTMLLPTEFGSAVVRDVTAASEQIEASLRRTEQNASHALAAQAVTAAIQQMPRRQQQFYHAYLPALRPLAASPSDHEAFESAIRQQTGVGEAPYTDLVERLSTSWANGEVPLEPSGDGRQTLRNVLDLEQRTASRANEERKKALEAVVAAVFAKAATPELTDVVQPFVDVLVDSISDLLSKRLAAKLAASGILQRVSVLWRGSKAPVDPAFTRDIIRASDLDGFPNNDEEIQARAEDGARKAYRMAEEKESHVIKPLEPSEREVPRNRTPFDVPGRVERRSRPRPFIR